MTLHWNGPNDNLIHTFQVALITDYKPRASTFGPKMRSHYKQCIDSCGGQLLVWVLSLRYRKTSKCKYPFTFSSDREGWVKDSVLQRDRLIHRIQLRNVPMAAEKVADAKMCQCIVFWWGIYQTWVAMRTTRPKLVAFFRLTLH